jgi:hypothetical protein
MKSFVITLMTHLLAALHVPASVAHMRVTATDTGDIAQAIATASSEPGRAVFPNVPFSVEKSEALMVSVSWFESGWHETLRGDCKKYIDLGLPCEHPSCGPFQLRSDSEADCVYWETHLLEGAREALRRIAQSFKDCAGSLENPIPVLDRLAEYTSGACDRGLPESRHRMKFAALIWEESHVHLHTDLVGGTP